ncbi:MAG: DNA-processing protein DprA [Bacillota bacterium]
MQEKAVLWIWFSMIKGLNNSKLQKIISLCEGVENLWNAKTREDLSDFLDGTNELTGISENLLRTDLKEQANRIFEGCNKSKIKVTFPGGEGYPVLLEYTNDKPMVLYVRGELNKEDKLLAIIGSRTATSYGLDVAFSFSKKLAESGITIVSGLARGVDTYAHAGAIKGRGRTIAVLGCGVDIAYPSENAGLLKEIEKNGAIISELPPGTRPSKYTFPLRNRIIAGMSAGVFVTEAGPDSGTRITVDYANNYGKAIYAVPGEITRQNFFGTNKMLKDGAIFVTNTEDILASLKSHYLFPEDLLNSTNYNLDFGVPMTIKNELSEVELSIVKKLELETKHVDELSNELKMVDGEIYVWLLMLELKGIIHQLPGRYYKIKNTFL